MRKNLLMRKATTKIKRPEQTTQIGVFSHLTPLMQAQKYRKFIAYHVPNGGGRSAAEAGILKAMGTLSGVADITVHLPPAKKHTEDYCSCKPQGRTIFIELKMMTMRLSKKGPTKGEMVPVVTTQEDSQVWFEGAVVAMGFPYHLVEATDISDALNKILDIIKTEGGFDW